MKNLFNAADSLEIRQRIDALRPDAQRQWGKMNVAQMLTHLSIAMENAAGVTPRKQMLLGRILGPIAKPFALGEKPFGKNGPTDPSFVVADARDFEAERSRLTGVIDKFIAGGSEQAAKQVHPFFGRLTGEQWGILTYKHIDHHLRQFGA